jgi:isobutyryl-CoA mutase
MSGSELQSPALHIPVHPVRLVTAASLFDGHDAAINIMRRLLQRQGAEVVHLGHNRSVDEVVTAAVQEDVTGVAISSYQGGHLEYFEYLVDRLAEAGRPDIRVYGGGGGVITAEEIATLQRYGVSHIFSPEDGMRLGLEAMVNTMVAECDILLEAPDDPLASVESGDPGLARVLSAIENGQVDSASISALRAAAQARPAPVLGITGTGGSGKSSLTDELVRRFRLDREDKLRIAVLAVDPTRRRGGGALLGDRIRMNAIEAGRVYFRSLATRGASSELPAYLGDAIAACRAAGYDLVIVETPGIGQGDAAIVGAVDVSVYVMTPEFGAPSQLEKIDMLELADVVAVNKYERRGGQDALREVRRQLARYPEHLGVAPDDQPVYGTVASRFNDDGVTALYQHLTVELAAAAPPGGAVDLAVPGQLPLVVGKTSTLAAALVPPERVRYLAEIVEALRSYHARTEEQAAAAHRLQQLDEVAALLDTDETDPDQTTAVRSLAAEARAGLDDDTRQALDAWPATRSRYRGATVEVDGRESELTRTSLSGLAIPRVALPGYRDHGDLVRWLRSENLPGSFPFTAGVFPFKRTDEDPARMFAGEGDPARTNRRFKLLAEGQPATRLSTAFDSVTLYGFDPDERPDIYGKVGNAGVSVATLDDMKTLYDGFDLTSPATSVSMTINGPAPTILAMYFNTVIDQVATTFEAEHGRGPDETERQTLAAQALQSVRGTVQADILKEDQGQNTCIYSTEFSLRMMSDIQQWFIDHQVHNFYSVSISGYHIAEAGANPISQLAFTLANAFTYVETYLARSMDIDDFAPNLSFFFSNGMDPEYNVIGRVARRIWAVALRDRYRANTRSQRLKYHIQTSGRSLHAQEMSYNEIRTTLQALCAIYDNANSLHTNAYDEAVTTPSEESVRRALAIQLIINREWGMAFNENPLQGSFIVEELTDLVEEAVLNELTAISERGGVLGAMETGYQRGRIQDDSLLYESRKHDGTLPLIGVNTFLAPVRPGAVDAPNVVPLARSTDDEKQGQLRRLREFQAYHAGERDAALARLQETALDGGNLFAVLMDAVRVCSLGQVTEALFDVGGRYRRNV